MEERNPRLTTGSSPVYHRFIRETRSALCSWLPTSGTTLFCLCKPFSCQACPRKSYTNRWRNKNPRLNRGSSAVYLRDKKRSLFLAADQWTDAFLSLETFFMQCMSGNILYKPMEERNLRLTTGCSPVFQGDEKRSLFLAADKWNDAFLSL